MPTRLVFTFVDEGVSAIAELHEDQAPKTCAAVIAALPQNKRIVTTRPIPAARSRSFSTSDLARRNGKRDHQGHPRRSRLRPL